MVVDVVEGAVVVDVVEAAVVDVEEEVAALLDGVPVDVVCEALGSTAGASRSPAGVADGSARMMSRLRRS